MAVLGFNLVTPSQILVNKFHHKTMSVTSLVILLVIFLVIMLVHRTTLDLETIQEIILVAAHLVEHILVPGIMPYSSQMGTWVSLLSLETLVDLETTLQVIFNLPHLVEHILVLEHILVTTQALETFQVIILVAEHILVTTQEQDSSLVQQTILDQETILVTIWAQEPLSDHRIMVDPEHILVTTRVQEPTLVRRTMLVLETILVTI